MGSSTEQTSSIYEAILLKLEDGHELSKPRLSLDELRDLESKLVLITGSNAEYRQEVDQYLDVSMVHIFKYFVLIDA